MTNAVHQGPHLFGRTLFRRDGVRRQKMRTLDRLWLHLTTPWGYGCTPFEPVALGKLVLAVRMRWRWAAARARGLLHDLAQLVAALTVWLAVAGDA